MTSGLGTKALAPSVFHRLRAYLLGHTPLPQFLECTRQYAPHYLEYKSSSAYTLLVFFSVSTLRGCTDGYVRQLYVYTHQVSAAAVLWCCFHYSVHTQSRLD